MKKTVNYLAGILIGIINIVIGACGGIVAIECLKKNNINQTKAHATAISIILPLTVISAFIYLINNNVKFSDSYVYIIPGVIGSFVGAALLPKIPSKILSKIFSIFMIYAGVRMFLK